MVLNVLSALLLGYCWCVTSDGDPIPGTSTHDADVDANDVTCKSSKVCTPRDSTEFNEQLVESFVTEYRMTTKSGAEISRYDVTSCVCIRHNQTWLPTLKLPTKLSISFTVYLDV